MDQLSWTNKPSKRKSGTQNEVKSGNYEKEDWINLCLWKHKTILLLRESTND